MPRSDANCEVGHEPDPAWFMYVPQIIWMVAPALSTRFYFLEKQSGNGVRTTDSRDAWRRKRMVERKVKLSSDTSVSWRNMSAVKKSLQNVVCEVTDS
jgi:hypothetical protein